MNLRSRLKALEGRRLALTNRGMAIRLFHQDDLTPCTLHQACDIEAGTGDHLSSVIRLKWLQRGDVS